MGRVILPRINLGLGCLLAFASAWVGPAVASRPEVRRFPDDGQPYVLPIKVLTAGLLGLLLLLASPVCAGKNPNGALIVHTAPISYYFNDPCGDAYDDPGTCENADTQTDNDENTPAMIWLIAAFSEYIDPAVTVIYFGLDQNLPEYYHERWGFCGPPGSIEVPDAGWPDFPATAGNSVAFGSPIVGNRLFPFYWVSVWGFEGAYYGTAINPVGGYAAFVDDSNPPQLDLITRFGQVRWYEPGYNHCPPQPIPGACCFVTGACEFLTDLQCEAAGGVFLGPTIPCDPNPCPMYPGACCFLDGHCELFAGIDCEHYTGDWLGEQSVCDPNPCPQPSQACCFADGSCTYVTAPDCEQEGGSPQGLGTNCDMISCKAPLMGACCFEDETCQVTDSEEACSASGGAIWFELEACEPNPCPRPAVERATWGQIKAGYR